MSKIVGRKNTEGILNSYNYNSLPSIMRALRQLMRLEEKAIMGNEAAAIIVIDIKSGMGSYKNSPQVLTPRQREVLYLSVILDLSETEVADRLDITQQSVHFIIRSAVVRIQRFLVTGEVKKPVFSYQETDKLIELYNAGQTPKDISEVLDKDPRSVRNKIKYLRKTKRIQGRR